MSPSAAMFHLGQATGTSVCWAELGYVLLACSHALMKAKVDNNYFRNRTRSGTMVLVKWRQAAPAR